jgi:hypothetical protein
LPLSSSLSWWLPALLRWRKVGGDKRVRKVPRGDLARSSYAYCRSHPRTAQGRPPLELLLFRVFILRERGG